MFKRGRPSSFPSGDVALQRRREQTAARVRQLRERRRAAIAAASLPPTQAQADQEELIVSRGLDAENPPPTDRSLGFRVTPGLDLPRDPEDVALQQQAIDFDEHEQLYGPETAEPASGYDPGSQSSGVAPFVHWPEQVELIELSDDSDPEILDSQPDGRPQSPVVSPRERVSSVIVDIPAPRSGRPARAVISDSEGSDSFHDFGSEHSGSNEAGDDEAADNDDEAADNNDEAADNDDEVPEPTPLEYTVEKLLGSLGGHIHGCTPEHHSDLHREHMAEVQDHHPLAGISTLSSGMSTLHRPDLLRPVDIQTQDRPSEADWQSCFCGVDPAQEQSRPRHICLHAEETRQMEAAIAHDVDSFLGFTSSLAVARQGLWFVPSPLKKSNIQTDVHLQTAAARDGGEGEGDDAPRLVPTLLKDVAHCLIGRVEGAQEISLYVLFPFLTLSGGFQQLTDNQLSRWLDRALLPAVYRHYPAHYTQHLPASREHALANSFARQTEGRVATTGDYRAQQLITYFLQPEFLHDIWTDALDTTSQTPGLHDLREPQLFFAAKNTKLQFKTSPSRPALRDVMDNFQSYFERIMDLELIHPDRFYVDLAKEICPQNSFLRRQTAGSDQEPQVYLWKRCCLESHLDWLYDGRRPRSGQTFFRVSMLRDGCNLTGTTPRRSSLRAGGLVYSQFYASVKEVLDAAKTFPFHNEGLEELALSPLLQKGLPQARGQEHPP